MKELELKPVGRQKSFYNKAVVQIMENGDMILKSYNTPVCAVVGGKFCRIWYGYSATTAKHIDAFRHLNGLAPMNKKEWLYSPVYLVSHTEDGLKAERWTA